jgi:TolB protein
MNGDNMSRFISFVLFAGLTLFAVGAESKVYLDVYGQSYKKITIAVPPFASEEKPRPEISDLLSRDLDMSGFFVVAPRSLMDNGLVGEGMDKRNIKFDQWRSLGVELLCKALVQEKDNGFSLEAYLYDASDGSLLFAKRYRATPSEWRRIVHRLADEIILTVTGEKGIMSSRVLFVAGDRRHRDVYVADLDGYGPRKLTDQRQIVVSPSVSPDGKYLAFTSYKEGRPNLYVVELATNREVYADRQDGTKVGSSWMNAKTIAYAHILGKVSTIYAANVETKQRTVLMKKEGILSSPTFSPDGTKMVFVSDMHGGPNIFITDLATGETKRLSYFGNYNTEPAYSPKGDLIAFVSKTEGALEICVMRPDGSNARVLSDGGINDSPQFSPCGRYILYSSQMGKKTSIRLMLHNGENKRELKFTGNEETQPKFMP